MGGELYFGNVWVETSRVPVDYALASRRPTRPRAVHGGELSGGFDRATRRRDESATSCPDRACDVDSADKSRSTTRPASTTTSARVAGAGNRTSTSLFVQDSWRWTPTLTINAGVRWDVQMPFYPVNDVMSMSSTPTPAAIRHRRRRQVPLVPTRRVRRQSRVRAVRFGKPRLEHRLEQRRAERQCAWRPNVRAAGCGPSWAIPNRPHFAGRLFGHVRPSRAWRSSPGLRRESRIDAERDAERGNGLLVPAGRNLAGVLDAEDRLPGPPCFVAVPGAESGRVVSRAELHAGLSDPASIDRQDADQHLLAGHRSVVRQSFIPELPALITRNTASGHPVRRDARDRSVDGRRNTTRSTCRRTDSPTSSSSRWRTCRPTSPPAAARRSRTSAAGPARARCRSTSRISTPRRDATTRRLQRDELDEHHLRRPAEHI